MMKIVYQEKFPHDQYKAVENELQCEEKNYKRYAYMRTQSNFEYLIYQEQFRCPPKWIKERIIAEINDFQQYKDYISVANRAYVYQSDGQLNIFLRFRPNKRSTLETVVSAKKHQDPLSLMQKLAQIVKMLHQNNHSHGRLKLSNIIYKKQANIKLGMPEYFQIQKWKRYQNYYFQSNCQIQLNDDIKTSSDLYSLGFVFLQVMISQVLPQDLPLSDILSIKLSLVKDKNISKLIEMMLKQQIDIRDIPKILDNLKDKYNLELLNPKTEDFSRYSIFKFYLFHQTQPSNVDRVLKERNRIVKFHSANLGTINFIFSKDENLFVSLFNKTLMEITADISICFSRIKTQYNQFKIEHLCAIIQDEATKFELSVDGDLLMYCPITLLKDIQRPKEGVNNDRIDQPTEQMSQQVVVSSINQINQQTNIIYCSIPDFKNSCRIYDKQVRKGSIVTEQIILSIFLEDQPVNISNQIYVIFGINKLTFFSYDLETIQKQIKIDQICYKFSLAFVNFHNIRIDFKNYLKLVKDYSQNAIMQKVVQQEGIVFAYELGDTTITPGDIAFYQNSFELHNILFFPNQIPTGQLLRVVFSTNCSAVIGIHIKDGRGFLIDAQFEAMLYLILSKWRTEKSLLMEPHPFVFIQCKQFKIKNGQIRNINDSAIKRFLEVNSIKDRQTAQDLLCKIVRQGYNYSDLGFYHYLIGTQFNRNDPQLMMYHLDMAAQYFKKINGTLIHIIYMKMGDILQQNILKEKPYLQKSDKQLLSIIYCKGIKNHEYFHLSIDLCFHLRLIEVAQDNDTKIDHLQSARDRSYFFPQHLLSILSQLLELRQLLSHQQVSQIQQKIAQTLQLYPHLQLPSQNLQTKMEKIQEKIRTQQFNLVTSEFKQLFFLFSKDIQDKNDTLEQIMNIWKTAYVQFIASCSNNTQLAAFEEFSKTHFEYCYHHAANSFRQKEKCLRMNNKKQANS